MYKQFVTERTEAYHDRIVETVMKELKLFDPSDIAMELNLKEYQVIAAMERIKKQ